MISFIHVADLHLDRPYAVSEGVAKKIANSMFDVYKKIIDTAISEKVDFVIFAGDTFHQSRISISTQAQFLKGIERLADENIQVVMTFGNHDYYQENRYWFAWPDNVTLFLREKVETIRLNLKDAAKNVFVSGFSYTHPHIERDLAKEFPPVLKENDAHIGIYHGEAGANNPYAPFIPSELTRLGYDYFALGHIHKNEFVNEEHTLKYIGTPQGRNKKETGAGVVALVTIDHHQTRVREIPVNSFAFESAKVDVSKFHTLQELRGFLETKVNTTTILTLTLTNAGELEKELTLAIDSGELQDYLSKFGLVDEIKLEHTETIQTNPLKISEEKVMDIIEKIEPVSVARDLMVTGSVSSAIQYNDAWERELRHQVFENIAKKFEFTELLEGETHED
jgi:DNA repair exonuclease SbcCD nuclease subunit